MEIAKATVELRFLRLRRFFTGRLEIIVGV